MNWDAIGAIAVLATLIYLARQIRQNRESVESAAAESVLSNLNSALQSAASSSQVANVLIAGQENLDTLTEEERGQFIFWFLSYFRILEQAYHHYLAGNFKPTIWEGHARHTQALLKTSGVGRYWEIRKGVFSPEFREYLDQLVSEESTVPSGQEAMKILANDK